MRCKLQYRRWKVCSLQLRAIPGVNWCSGPARVGAPAEEATEFTRFFGTIVDRDYIDAPDPGSQLLLVPSDGKLHLTISNIGV